MSIQLSLFGASTFAKAYVRAAKRLRHVEIASVFSRSPARAKQFARAAGIRVASANASELLSSEKLDGVIIATEPDRHIDLALLALNAGIPVLIEKPLSDNVRDEKKYIDLFRFENRVSVSSPKRFDPDLTNMQKEFDRVRSNPFFASIKMLWSRSLGYYGDSTGWKKRSHFFLNQGIHWLDVCNWFFGKPEKIVPDVVSTREGIECFDHGSVTLHYKSGSRVVFFWQHSDEKEFS